MTPMSSPKSRNVEVLKASAVRNDIGCSTAPLNTKNLPFRENRQTEELFRSKVLPSVRSVSPTASNHTSSASSSPHQSPIAIKVMATSTDGSAVGGFTRNYKVQRPQFTNHHEHPILYPLRTHSVVNSCNQESKQHREVSSSGPLQPEPQLQRRDVVCMLPTQINKIPCDRLPSKASSFTPLARAVQSSVSSFPTATSSNAPSKIGNKSTTTTKTSTDRGHLDLLAFVMEYDLYLKTAPCR